MFPLTDNQLKIVNHINGSLLVVAGPGSGKTRVLTERIINLLNMGKKRILSLTFSNKAAEEISERLKTVVDENVYENVFVGTIHSFCLDVVMNRGKLIGLPSGLMIFENESDRIEILKQVFNDLLEFRYLIQSDNSKNSLKNCLNRISKLKQNFISPDILQDSNLESDIKFSRIYRAYNNKMLAQKAIDFDDILFYAYKIFTERPQIAKSYTRLYKYIFVDEAQDLNEAQYKTIKGLCQNFSNIMMVGDPAQSIYGFNGSDSKFMTYYFKKDFNPSEYKLNENFRSTKRIIEAAKKIQKDSDSEAVYPLEGELEIKRFENEVTEAEWIANKIDSLLKDGDKWVEDIKYEDIAIIARNRYVLSTLVDVLKLKSIAYNYGSNSGNIESESLEIKIFEAGLRIIVNPYDNVHFNHICNLINYKNDLIGEIDTNYLVELFNIDFNGIDNDHKILLKALQKAWKILIDDEDRFSKSIDVIEEAFHLETKNKTLTDNDQYLIHEDIKMWKEHWKKYCSQTVAGNRSISHFRNQVSLGRTQMYDNSGVSLLTVHMSKGLEFNIVFLLGMNEGTFPDYRAVTEQSYKEELNNMFVALTRAKRMCFLTYPQSKTMPWGKTKIQSPSRFIKMIE